MSGRTARGIANRELAAKLLAANPRLGTLTDVRRKVAAGVFDHVQLFCRVSANAKCIHLNSTYIQCEAYAVVWDERIGPQFCKEHMRQYWEGRLFICIFPTGFSYADRYREESGDYKRIAFLPYTSLVLEWYDENVSPELKEHVMQHANTLQAKRGQHYQVSTSGQTVLLGGT